jgi:phosphatidylinositol alpha-1,6-mannosyltransferase
MKLLLISSTNNVRNGYGNFTHEYCRALQAKGISFTLLLPVDEPRYEYATYPVEYILPPYIFNVKTKKIFKYLTFSYKTDADVIHSLFEFPYALIGAKIARQNKKPLIIGGQGTYAVKPLLFFGDKQALIWAYNTATRIVTSSAFTKKILEGYSQIKTKISIIHNGVNLKRFDVKVETADIQAKFHSKKIILTTGVLKPRKGHDVVIKALGELKKKRDDFHYVIVGPSDEKDRDTYIDNLKQSIKDLNLSNNVTFAGSLSDADLVNYFHACYLFVHTPRIVHWNFEGFGIVYLEASACKKPIVAGDSGGIRDAVVDGKTGIVVPENDPQATALAIETLLNNPPMAQKMGEAGYEYAKEHDWSRIAEQYLDLYNELQ